MTTRKMDGLASFGVDLNARSFLLDGPVDQEMLRTAWSSLAALGVSKPVTCFISSEGGELDIGFAIYDLFRNFENTLNIVVLGNCCSAATIILLAGDNRFISENSYCMIHLGTITVTSEDSEANMKKWIRHYDRYTDKMIALYAETLKMSKAQVKKLITLDKHYLGQEAVDCGLVHHIWNKKP